MARIATTPSRLSESSARSEKSCTLLTGERREYVSLLRRTRRRPIPRRESVTRAVLGYFAAAASRLSYTIEIYNSSDIILMDYSRILVTIVETKANFGNSELLN